MDKFTETTNSGQLLFWLKRFYEGKKFDVNVVARDQLKKLKQKEKQIIIVNLNKSNQIGSHWVLIVNKSNWEAVFFDSYGLPPPTEVLQFMRGYKKEKLVGDIIQTTRTIQGKNDDLCGYYCMKFLDLYVSYGKEAYMAVVEMTRKNTLAYAKRLFKLSKQIYG